MASIVGLFVKPGSTMPMASPPGGSVDLRAGYGITGDANANPLSPRQVLVTRHEDLCHFRLEPGALRENIVIAGLDEIVFQPGTRLDIGSASIRLTFHCEPCKRISHLVRSLKDILSRRGLLGVVLTNGSVAIENEVGARPNAYEPLPERPYDRFLAFIAQVPPGKVVSYRDVTAGIGVASSYMRAMPRYLLQASTDNVHRVVDSEGALVESYVPDQAVRLLAEGVEVATEEGLFGSGERRYVDLGRFGWHDGPLYLR
jgi:alkylated DNA nucleotide flippase Atl1